MFTGERPMVKYFYVGLGSKSRPFEMGKTRRTKKWWDVVQEHGIEVEVLADDLSLSEAQELEQLLILEYGFENLVNHTGGGETGPKDWKHTDETKAKMAESLKGHTHNLGRVCSEETKGKLGAPVTVGDIEFKSMTDAAKAFGITKQAVKYRCESSHFDAWSRAVKDRFSELEASIKTLLYYKDELVSLAIKENYKQKYKK